MIPGSSSILVISDSHGNVPALTAALDWARQAQIAQNETFTAAIFLGDGTGDLSHASAQADFSVSWYKVRGNGDINFSIPVSLVMEIPGHQDLRETPVDFSRKLFLAHGNRHDVNEGGRIFAAAAKAAGAEAALFGHTHVPHRSILDGIFLLNPGSIGRSRSDAGPTFAVLECPDSGPFNARFFHLVRKGGKINVEEMQV